MLQILTQSKYAVELCSRCMHNEINSWLEENWQHISQETKNLIIQELRTIKLSQGKCIVCNNELVSLGTGEKILKILKENKIESKVLEDFKKSFVC